MVKFLERLTGKKMDWDRMGEVMDNSRQSLELWRQIFELRKPVPCPANNRLLVYLLSLDNYAGSPEYLNYLQCLRADLQAKMNKGIAGVPEEKHRLMSFMMAPQHSFKLLDWIAGSHRAVIVSEPFIPVCPEDVKFDRAKPPERSARKSVH